MSGAPFSAVAIEDGGGGGGNTSCCCAKSASESVGRDGGMAGGNITNGGWCFTEPLISAVEFVTANRCNSLVACQSVSGSGSGCCDDVWNKAQPVKPKKMVIVPA